MLNTRLENIWKVTSEAEKLRATNLARHTLENLVHYRSGGRYTPDDIEYLAATFVFFQAHRGEKPVKP